ncbi:Fc.00g019290.m01.CDS01 [Cosmosporella sp. VM-42]
MDITTPQPTQPIWLRKDFTQVPITALSFYRSKFNTLHVLAGEDNELVVYHVTSGNVVIRRCVLQDQPIQGIHVQGEKVLVWGGREVCLVDIEGMIDGEGEVRWGKAEDWVYDAVVSPYDPTVAVLATAHNEVVCLHLDWKNLTFNFGSIISPSRPILYAANLKWLSEDTVLVAAGTVFGEIQMWKCYLSEKRHEMLSVLSGHEGSIFGVHISDEVELAGERVRLVASCSDDRTVRIWDVTERNGDEQQRHSAVPDTGFGAIIDGNTTSQGMNRVVAVAMGHASRIWGVKFALPEGGLPNGEPITVYSFGEDSTMQRWRLDLDASSRRETAAGSRGEPGTLTYEEAFSLHDGKHLWSHALAHEDGRTLIATGGADGKISLISDLAQSLNTSVSDPEQPHELINLILQDALAALPNPQQPLGPRETFSRYDFIKLDQILAGTTNGRLFLGTFNKGLTWREVEVEESITADLKLRYVLGDIGPALAVLGTTTGNLYHYSEEKGVSHIGSVPGKIVHIFNLSGSDTPEEASVDILVHTHGSADAHYFTLDCRSGVVQSQIDVKGLDSRFVFTAASTVNGQLLAIGSRHGYLSLLRRGQDGYRPVLDVATRSKDAITRIVPLPSTPGTFVPSPYFLATSRDGKYRVYEIENVEQDIRIHLRHEASPPLGPMIEGAWFTRESTPELILYGFRSKNFVVWNETRREELVTLECGGSHRSFSFIHHSSDQNNLRFAYTKVSRLYVYSKHRSTYRPLKQGIHGREIRALSSNGRLIATGAEDTTIRIWDYRKNQKDGTSDNRELQCVAFMKLHITGLQQLKWLGDDYLFSSAGNEEFFVWRIRRLETGYAGLGVVCEAVFDDKSRDGDLRIMDFDVCKTESDNSLLITMVLSNSALKTYRYTQHEGFRVLARMSYTGACLTQIRHLGVDARRASVLTASTDGHLATWEVRLDRDKVESHVLVHVAPIHQSAIKSLDLRSTSEGYLVLTGGDDNGLGVTSVTPLPSDAGTRRYTVSHRGIVRKAHAASINGVLLVSRGKETLGVTASNDQRVRVWRIGSDHVKLVADRYSGVADPGDIEVLNNVGNEGSIQVMVGGVGVEVWGVWTDGRFS